MDTLSKLQRKLAYGGVAAVLLIAALAVGYFGSTPSDTQRNIGEATAAQLLATEDDPTGFGSTYADQTGFEQSDSGSAPTAVDGGSNDSPSKPKVPTEPSAPTDPEHGDGGNNPGQPDPTGGTQTPPPPPQNSAPTISDVDIAADGFTVVVTYRAADPEGDDVSSSVAFADGGIVAPPTPQGPATLDDRPSGRSPRSPTLPTAPSPPSGPRAPTRPPVPTPPTFPTPTSELSTVVELPDGRTQVTRRFSRSVRGETYSTRITIGAVDSEGAETNVVRGVDLVGIDQLTISEVTYSINNSACFSGFPALRLFGNLDFRGALDSTTALNNELRADKATATIAPQQTFEISAESDRTIRVTLQPAIAPFQLDTYEMEHSANASIEAEIKVLDSDSPCVGELSYSVSFVER